MNLEKKFEIIRNACQIQPGKPKDSIKTIMVRAWEFYRQTENALFSECLRESWEDARLNSLDEMGAYGLLVVDHVHHGQKERGYHRPNQVDSFDTRLTDQLFPKNIWGFAVRARSLSSVYNSKMDSFHSARAKAFEMDTQTGSMPDLIICQYTNGLKWQVSFGHDFDQCIHIDWRKEGRISK